MVCVKAVTKTINPTAMNHQSRDVTLVLNASMSGVYGNEMKELTIELYAMVMKGADAPVIAEQIA